MSMLTNKVAKIRQEPDAKTQLHAVLNALLEENKISLVQLQHNTGVPLTTLKRMRSPNPGNPTLQSLLPIANFFGISVDQLIGLKPLQTNHRQAGYHEAKDYWVTVPIIAWEDILVLNQHSRHTSGQWTKTDLDVSDTCYALKVNCSHWNEFALHSILIIDPNKEPSNESYVVAWDKVAQVASLYKLIIQGRLKYIQPLIKGIAPIPLTHHYQLVGVVVQTRLDF